MCVCVSVFTGMNSVSAEPNVRPIKVYWDQVVLVSLKVEADLFNQTWGWVWWYWWQRWASWVVGFSAPLLMVMVSVLGLGSFSRCTGRASESPLRNPAFSTHCTWTPPVVLCSAPSWECCPERKAGKVILNPHSAYFSPEKINTESNTLFCLNQGLCRFSTSFV